MAHEFAHYDRARGPEGLRRTVTHYGPVVGGLPINAWHCEQCGLLRLNYPDGRREERRLLPGPQPGLLARPSAEDERAEKHGRQARVSGLSISHELAAELTPSPAGELVLRLPAWQLPGWEALTWFNVLALAGIVLGLFAAAVMAVVGYNTADGEGQLVLAIAALFGLFLAVNAAMPLLRRVFPMPALSPSAAESEREPFRVEGVAAAAVMLLVATACLLLVAAILAVYTYNTSSAEGIVFIAALACAFFAIVTLIVGSIVRPRP